MLLLHIRPVLACLRGEAALDQLSHDDVLKNFSSHLPLLFVGMEQIMLSNHSLADEALNAAYAACDGDPLLINELGVMAFTHGE
jgi:hypothetical protein